MSQLAPAVAAPDLISAKTEVADKKELQVLTGLFQAMNAAEIRYCHWKSTYGLEKALQGGTDLDLLIERADAMHFRQMLFRRDFKLFVSAPRRQYPAVEDYIGFDQQTGALVHLHVHYRMILGEQYVKNYVLPLETSFLNHTQMKLGVRIPTPALEIIVLVLRALLKYRDRDGIRDLFTMGRSGIAASTQKELKTLLSQTSLEEIASATKQHADLVPVDLVIEFLETIQKAPRDARALLRLRGRVREVLAPYRRAGTLAGRADYYRTMLVQELPIKPLRNLLLEDRHKKSATGGVGIAFIGTDGAGKSTNVRQIARWLGWRMNVHVFYMGTTHPSPETKIWRMLLNVGHLVSAASGRIWGKQSPITLIANWVEQWLTDHRLIAEGKDRYHRYVASQRKLAQGDIVIYDRYPLEAVRIDGRAMDGPRIAVNGLPQSKLLANLAHAEQEIYRKIRPPEHVVVLRVSPEVSLARKPEHRRERIDAKSQALGGFARDGLNVTEVDAEQPLDQVLLQIKTAIWSWL